ncbi:hypothetical protein HHK36_001597 [Tetracentron sinense]|uniref:Uncharacterized protein n=1 Tax=Tetracentron sinense TaxID=13715 RepID=A0A834ZXT9_TETSI|nr:hypothetical protein HHK36_001597 [Tetracentron sinense]
MVVTRAVAFVGVASVRGICAIGARIGRCTAADPGVADDLGVEMSATKELLRKRWVEELARICNHNNHHRRLVSVLRETSLPPLFQFSKQRLFVASDLILFDLIRVSLRINGDLLDITFETHSPLQVLLPSLDRLFLLSKMAVSGPLTPGLVRFSPLFLRLS